MLTLYEKPKLTKLCRRVSCTYDFKGESRQFEQSGNALLVTFFLFCYSSFHLVLAAQFESWRDPLIILYGPNVGGGAMAFIMLWFQGR
jgi:multidrug efflux pump